MFTNEVDEFTGLKKITTQLISLQKFKVYKNDIISSLDRINDSDSIIMFDLVYAEAENGQGVMAIRIDSTLKSSNGWYDWQDEWPFIIDGERVSLVSKTQNEYKQWSEYKIYELTTDILYKISNAKELKYSLRGKNRKVDGILSNEHQIVFKAFEKYCFGDEGEANSLIASIQNTIIEEEKKDYNCYNCKSTNRVANKNDNFNCYKCGKSNTIIKPKNLNDEEKLIHEKKVIELLNDKKIDDAVKYYSANFGLTAANSLIKIKELAEKNGSYSVYSNYMNRKPRKNLIIGLFILSVTLFLINARYLIDTENYHDQQVLRRLNNAGFLYFLEAVGLIIVIINLIKLFKKK
jgi:Zn finger protein HypA/HybF involved in hydrogenase expression